MADEVAETLENIASGTAFASHPMQVVHAVIQGKPVLFATDMENDPVQRNHRLGQFYEAKELASLRAHFPEQGVFFDVGANVGNHALYAALFLGASRVVVVEPNPRAYRLLIQNVLLNRLTEVFDLSKLGVGLAAAPEEGYAMEDRDRNLGAAKMLPGQGDIRVMDGDTFLGGVTPDFIKIDVEGMELDVLTGLAGIIARARPVILIEVDNENEDLFRKWVQTVDYEIVETIQRYRLNKNFLVRPKP